MAFDISCALPSTKRDLASRAVDKLTEEQKNLFKITDQCKNNATFALKTFVGHWLEAEKDPDTRYNMERNVTDFVSTLESHIMRLDTDPSTYEIKKAYYDAFLKDNPTIGRIFHMGYSEGQSYDELKKQLTEYEIGGKKINLIEAGIIEVHPSYNKGNLIGLDAIVKEPRLLEEKSPQDKAWEELKKIQGIEYQGLKTEYRDPKNPSHTGWYKNDSAAPKDWIPTGRRQYRLEGQKKPIIAEWASGAPSTTKMPILSAPLGRVVDNIGRLVFAEKSKLYDEKGKLLNDEELKHEAGAFESWLSTQGFLNLVHDFDNLKSLLKNKWPGARFWSEDIALFGKKAEVANEWTMGKPDLLVIDNTGTVHVLDFKTFHINADINYNNPLKEDLYERNKKYGSQETKYIKTLSSYGLKVDSAPYVVLIDTFYNSKDIDGSVYTKNGDSFYIKEEDSEISLGAYAEQQREEYKEQKEQRDLIFMDVDSSKYIEPRLHGRIENIHNKSISSSAENSLQSESLITDETVTFVKSFELLSEEEKQEIQWFLGKPAKIEPGKALSKLSPSDIESAPDIISTEEIYSIAEDIMYTVSDIIDQLERGEEVDFHLGEKGKFTAKKDQYKGLSREEIIDRLNIADLLDTILFDHIPLDTEEMTLEDFDSDEEEYNAWKKHQEKAAWIHDDYHKWQLFDAGLNKLIALERTIIPVLDKDKIISKSQKKRLEDVITALDEEAAIVTEQYNEGVSDLMAWMFNQRNVSQKASLSQEIKRMLERIIVTDNNGDPVIDDRNEWNFYVHLDSTKAVQAILDVCCNCETIEQMENALENAGKVDGNNWMLTVLNTIRAKGNETLRTKFFINFRKDRLTYSISQYDAKTDTVTTKIINLKSASKAMLDSLGVEFFEGKVGEYRADNGKIYHMIQDGKFTTQPGNKTSIFHMIRRDLSKLQNKRNLIYQNNRTRTNTKEEREKAKEKIKEEIRKEILPGIHNILQGIGVMVPLELVEAHCNEDPAKKETGNLGTLIASINKVLEKLDILKNDNIVPRSLSNNKSYGAYKDLLEHLSMSVQEYVEDSVYQDGKTYYSYTNPSKIGHIVRNLKDALNDPEEFTKFIEKNYGRYVGWFKQADGKTWLNDALAQITATGQSGVEYRKNFDHKVELSFIGSQYKDLGSLGFMRSILHNYFGNKDDKEFHRGYHWFALPTMSNKPTNEFIRMKAYKNHDEIIDKVLMNTFKQEMNRIADVLFNFANNGRLFISDMDLDDASVEKLGLDTLGFQKRINRAQLTLEDLKKLTKSDSGAKFHFLWYLNNAIDNDEDLGQRVVDQLNLLLSDPDSEAQKNKDLSKEAETYSKIRDVITASMEEVVASELKEMEKIGLFDPETRYRKVPGRRTPVEYQVLRYQEEFGGDLGTFDHEHLDVNDPNKTFEEARERMKTALTDYIWQDIAANINIIQLTGVDLAYYKNSVNYQKRIAQLHSPGLHLMHDEEIDDGYLRSVHISDEEFVSEMMVNSEYALKENKKYIPEAFRRDYDMMVSLVLKEMENINATDGQSFNSPSSMRKKLKMMGEWSEEREKVYNKIIEREPITIEDLGVMMQPTKPFVTADTAKFSGSTTMPIRKVPLQDKNSEYLIILAEALARRNGKRSKLVAIYDFMEKSIEEGKDPKKRVGIDTVHMASVGKVGVGKVINTEKFDEEFEERLLNGDTTEENYNAELTEYLLSHIRRANSSGKSRQSKIVYDAEEKMRGRELKDEELKFNSQYVDTIEVEEYIKQQEVPAHLLDGDQLYGSQSRILGISDISPDTDPFNVNGKSLTADALVKEYKQLHADNIESARDELMEELGFSDADINLNSTDMGNVFDSLPTEKRNKIVLNLHTLLTTELKKDIKYDSDLRRACSLVQDEKGRLDFEIPLMDMIQSKRIQMLLNSIIKKRINKQKIKGGPVVQTTCYDENLHIIFKKKGGGELDTFSKFKEDYINNLSMQGEGIEYPSDKELENLYKKYVQENQDGISHFECYLSVPNETLERFMLKSDGSMMSFEEVQKKLPPKVFDSMMRIIGYRIPTEDKYSIIPLKVKGFLPKAAGQVIMMPKEITFLTGSDFDIDKMYLMMKDFDETLFDTKGFDMSEAIGTILDTYKESGFIEEAKYAKTILNNANEIIKGNRHVSLTTNLPTNLKGLQAIQLNSFTEHCINYVFKNIFNEYSINDMDTMELPSSKRKARNNRILDLQWAVLTHHDTAFKTLNFGNFNAQKKVGRLIKALKEKKGAITEEEYKALSSKYDTLGTKKFDKEMGLETGHSVTLPMSKIYFQRQNMQGSQMVGIFANNNVSHAFMTFQKVAIDLTKKDQDKSFSFCGVPIGDRTRIDQLRGHDGQLISKTIASFLSASVDTAKDPTLSDMNINTFTGNVAMTLARLGFNTEEIGLFLSQPIIMQLSDLYFKRASDGKSYYDGFTAIHELASTIGLSEEDLLDVNSIRPGSNTLSVRSFLAHLNDEDITQEVQKSFLIAFNALYNITKDMQTLTFCTKFNSVNNAAGPTIADTILEKGRVEDFINNISETCFYEPEPYETDYTSPKEVISSDPILNAFYYSTVGSGGMSEVLFKYFFPHYYLGYRQVVDIFKQNYARNGKINNRTYNRLLDAYVYYIMTYDDPDAGFAHIIPSSNRDLKALAIDLPKRFEALQARKDRKHNMLLDPEFGATNLYIRKKTAEKGYDDLYINTSQMSPETQQRVKIAWNELITSEDPEIRKFGIDLFFYSLMKNGFGFSPRSIMFLASTVVRYGATYAGGEEDYTNYVVGLRNLPKLDKYLLDTVADAEEQVKRFLDQFMRNNYNNRMLVPNFKEGKVDYTPIADEGKIFFRADKNKLYTLKNIMRDYEHPFEYITISKKENGVFKKELYKLSSVQSEPENIVIFYQKTTPLGISNDFIEYNANEDLKSSFYEEVRLDNEDEDGEDLNEQEDFGSAKEKEDDGIPTGESTEEVFLNETIKRLKDAGVDDKNIKALRNLLNKDPENPIFTKLMNEEITGEVLDEIQKIIDKQNPCIK